MSDPMRSLSIVDEIGHRLREAIISGRLAPGEQLVEVDLAEAYNASRNSIREVLHLLVRDGLATAVRYRGVFVRVFCEADLQDIYTARRTIQMQAIRSGPAYTPAVLDKMAAVLQQSRTAMAKEEWQDVGTLSLAFHQVQVSALGSRLIDDFFLNICAQLRLVFTIAPEERIVQKPMWVERESLIYELLTQKRYDAAEAELESYLRDSEEALTSIVHKYEPNRRFL
jgi:Transcriptional regulators